ncbi:hypothetical protein CH63R_05912 [Colletotrichum higginsianum IMI 349063]|uniref:Uncharacterized protein n=1 Tax=Colletotrichum higginsianum (strain IMI 349063) TaxID=759273 RepID=A0A1B7YE72_COLHI|nr:hypothetical protein CH63R_05912 [Colletotrichum higginsianum IMI 349063]OBR10220.1 hypothetical protein CH63R_05912 [Colletotrichum higginsianum IMI 349063]
MDRGAHIKSRRVLQQPSGFEEGLFVTILDKYDDILNPTGQEDDVAAVNSPPKVETVQLDYGHVSLLAKASHSGVLSPGNIDAVS